MVARAGLKTSHEFDLVRRASSSRRGGARPGGANSVATTVPWPHDRGVRIGLVHVKSWQAAYSDLSPRSFSIGSTPASAPSTRSAS